MIQIDTPFTAFKMTQEELSLARAITTEQRCYLQTLLSDAATEKLAEEYDPVNPLRFAQREAYLRGQMDILNMLLADTQSVTRPDRFKPEQPKETS